MCSAYQEGKAQCNRIPVCENRMFSHDFKKYVFTYILLRTKWVTDMQRTESSVDLGSWGSQEAIPGEEELDLDPRERDP